MWSSNPSIQDKSAFSSSSSMFSYVCSWHLKVFTRQAWRQLQILLPLHAMNSSIISRAGGPCNQSIESWSLSMNPQYPGLRLGLGILWYFSRLLSSHKSNWHAGHEDIASLHMEEVDKIPCLLSLLGTVDFFSSFTSAIVNTAAYSLQVLQISPSLPHAIPWHSDDSCLWLSA